MQFGCTTAQQSFCNGSRTQGAQMTGKSQIINLNHPDIFQKLSSGISVCFAWFHDLTLSALLGRPDECRQFFSSEANVPTALPGRRRRRPLRSPPLRLRFVRLCGTQIGRELGGCVRFGGVVSNDRAYWRTLSCKDCDAEMGDGGVSSRSEGELFQRKFLQRQGHFDPQIVPLYKEEITRQKSLRKH